MSVKKIFLALVFLIGFQYYVSAASVSILCYHSFWGMPKYAYDFSNQELRTQLNYFKRQGFHFVTIDDVLKNKVTGNRNLLVTIDDGNISAYRAYVQVFKSYKIKPVFAIYPAIISKDHYALRWEHVQEFLKDGCDISSHGYNHLFVAQKLFNKNPVAFKREIYTSKLVLEKTLKRPISTFTYPFGVCAPVSFKNVKQASYHFAFGLQPVPAFLPFENNHNIYQLPRYMFTRSNWKGLMLKIVKDVERLELQHRVIGN